MSTTVAGHNGESITSLVILVFTILCSFWLRRFIRTYIFPDITTNDSLPTPTPPSVTITVARFPASGKAPSLIRLSTTTKSLIQGPDVFPSHIPDVWPLWGLAENMSIYRDWSTIHLEDQPVEACDGTYMTIYSFAPHLRENHCVPKILQPCSRMLGDVFVAKLGGACCGGRGRAVYEDVNPEFLRLPCVTERQGSSRQ